MRNFKLNRYFISILNAGNKSATVFHDTTPNAIWNRVYVDIPAGMYLISIESDFRADAPDLKAALNTTSYYELPCGELGEH